MVKKITVIPVNESIVETKIITTPEVEDIIKVEEDIIKIEDDIIREKEEIATVEKVEDKPRQSCALLSEDDKPLQSTTLLSKDDKPKKVKKEMFKNMPTTEKVITQVQCQACGKSMSAKNLKYSHAAYCVKRVHEVSDKPKAIPVPKKIIPKLKKILPVKGVVQDDESDDVEAEFLQAQTLTIDEVEPDPMKKLKNKITKAQEEYKSNNKQPDLIMYKVSDVQRLENPEDIVAPTYEVRMKKAREKKQEKYDKLTSNAF
jgi:hypothetical protein